MSEDLGAQFCQASSRLPGLPKLQRVPDELLENDRVLQFLQWFCRDVHTSNVLTKDEIAMYQEIKRAGNSLQTGQLQAVVDRMEGYGCLAKDATTEQLRQEISDLQADVVQARDHLDMLVHLKGQLDRHHADLLYKKDTSKAKERSYQQQQQRKLHTCKRGNNKLNEHLEQLKSTVGNTMDTYREVDGELDCYEGSKPATDQSSFLSAYSLDSYHSVEEKFTQVLVAYTKKQFFQGIADLSSHSDINDDFDPSHSTLKMDEGLKEIQRLQTIYPVSEVMRINSVANEKQAMATVECAEKQLILLSQASYVSDDEVSFKASIAKLEQELSCVNVELKKVGCNQLPNLIQEIAGLQFTSVMTADHDLKLARQDYFTSKQDKVIDCLRCQLSRHQLVLMLYESELRKHRELYKLLKAVQSQLAQWKEAHDQKIKLLQELPQISITQQPRQALNPMDKVTFGVHKLLEDGMTSSTAVPTFTDLLSSCSRLVKHIEHLKSTCQLLQISQLHQIAELERNIFQYQQLLKRYNAEVDPNQPALIPKDLKDMLVQLTESANNLEIKLKQIMQDFNAKKKVLATNPWLQKERELFVHFFTNPARLQQMFSEIAATVDSNSFIQSPKTTI